MSEGRAPVRDGTLRDVARLTLSALGLFGTLALPHLVEREFSLPVALPALGFGLVLAILSAIDVKTLRLPDVLTYPLGLAGLLQGWFSAPDEVVLRGLGAAMGFLMLAVIAELYRRKRGIDGLGLGDAKLMGAGGAWIGIAGLPSALLLGSGLALILALGAKAVGRDIGAETRIPFGPFIAIGLWIVWLYGPIV